MSGERSTPGALTLDGLGRAVADGTIDTVMLAFCDMQGRLMGKRLDAGHFLGEVATHGAEACSYLLAVDVEMTPVSGYAITSWEQGYGDFVMRPDLATLRLAPWSPLTALCLADIVWQDDVPVAVSPRQILQRQLARLATRGWQANAATELEFVVFEDTYAEAAAGDYRGLRPANRYNVDYSLLGTHKVEPLIGRIRRAMRDAGFPVEDSKGECNLGQHEINFRYADALAAADLHAVFKTAAKEIAHDAGMAITFMAKYDEREGSSCHIHCSLADGDGPLFERDEPVFHAFLAGQLACLREFALLFAPNVNSYKRYAAASFAPTTVAWGRDNRTCALRIVGHGPSLRFENRAGGADLNPYLALAATVAAGLHGVEHGLALEPPLTGNGYAATDRPQLPTTLREARERFAASEIAREAFGAEVVEHYLHAADVELAAFESSVTDWERHRGFERL